MKIQDLMEQLGRFAPHENVSLRGVSRTVNEDKQKNDYEDFDVLRKNEKNACVIEFDENADELNSAVEESARYAGKFLKVSEMVDELDELFENKEALAKKVAVIQEYCNV